MEYGMGHVGHGHGHLGMGHGANDPVRATSKSNPIPDYLLWGCFRSSFASSSTPAGCLLFIAYCN
jgi:hypothetical protein